MNAAAQSGAEATSDHGRIPALDIEPYLAGVPHRPPGLLAD